MKHTRKSRKLHMVKRKQKGGVLEREGFPVCNTMASFSITDQSLASFQRVFPIPGDCVISALQLVGVIDAQAADIMRIATIAGSTWNDPEQIELVFVYRTMRNFLYSESDNYHQFVDIIQRELPRGSVVFAGYEAQNGQRHAFLIGRQLDGQIVYIDPQTNPSFCPLSDPRCSRFVEGRRSWQLLFYNPTQLSQAQGRRVIQYTTQRALVAQAEAAARETPKAPARETPKAPAWRPSTAAKLTAAPAGPLPSAARETPKASAWMLPPLPPLPTPKAPAWMLPPLPPVPPPGPPVPPPGPSVWAASGQRPLQ